MSSTVASDTQRKRVLNVFVNFEQFKEDYEDEIPSPSKKPVTEEMSEKKSPIENEKMDVPQKNEKGMEVFDLNDL